jgi:hypothetical protein
MSKKPYTPRDPLFIGFIVIGLVFLIALVLLVRNFWIPG